MPVTQITDLRMRRDASEIRTKLRETEDTSDALLEHTAGLMQAMVRARRTSDVAPHTGQAALMRLIKAQQSIVAGANDLFRVHDELSALGVELMIMDEGDATPPTKGLSAVESETGLARTA